MLRSRLGLPALVAALSLAAPVQSFAQVSAPVSAMPMPPSANDPAPGGHAAARTTTRHPKSSRRRAKRGTPRAPEQSGEFAPQGTQPMARERADAPSRQLEDDPRVQPQLSPGGGIGLGGRF